MEVVDALLGILRGEGEGGTNRSPAKRTAVGTRCRRMASARPADPVLLPDGLGPVELDAASLTAVCADAVESDEGGTPSVWLRTRARVYPGESVEPDASSLGMSSSSMTCEFLLRREDDRAASDEPNGTDEEATPELERDEAAPPWVPDELTLLERCELDEAGMGTGSGMLGLPASIAATRFGSTPSGPPTGEMAPSPSKTPPRERARRCMLELSDEEVIRLRRAECRMALPPPVTVVGVLFAEPLKLDGAKAPELLRLPRVSQLMVGEPEWNELEGGRPEDEPDESGEGLEGIPCPSDESSFRFPMEMVETGRSTGSRAGEPVAPPPMRRGTAGGPMDPVELVTDDLRVKLEPLVPTSSDAIEDASSSAAKLVLWKRECRERG